MLRSPQEVPGYKRKWIHYPFLFGRAATSGSFPATPLERALDETVLTGPKAEPDTRASHSRGTENIVQKGNQEIGFGRALFTPGGTEHRATFPATDVGAHERKPVP